MTVTTESATRPTTTREVERKYDAPEGAATPRWPDLPGLGSPAEPTEDTLVATYYDTADLRLLAGGLTLRRRTGGNDEGWHLKLPAGGDARDEIALPLSAGGGKGAGVVPAELAALTRSRTRGAPLVVVATLTTTRQRRRWTDADGRLRVEMVDDRVASDAVGGRHRVWREIEVELGPDADPALLDDVEAALLAAGARRSASANKLSVALGAAAPARPAAPRPGRNKKRPTAGAAALAYLAEQAAAIVRLDPGVRQDAPDAVHQMRVATRRMRSALQAFGPVLERDATRALTDELKWLAGVLGVARDLEVLRARIAAAAAALPEEDQLGPIQARVTKHFAPRQQAARADVVAALDSDRYLALLAAVDALLLDPPVTRLARRKAGDVLPRLVRRAYGRVAGHLEAAGAADGDARDVELHEARKAAKRVRYAAEAAEPALGAPARRVVTRAVAFQDILGEHQDDVVARPLLRRLALEAQAEGENAYPYGLIAGAGAAAADPAEVAAAARRLRKAVRHT